MRRIRSVFSAALVLAILSFSSIAAEREPAPLSLGFMPYLNSQVLMEKYGPLARYLSAALGREVEITLAKNYQEHIRLTGEDRLDISFLGGSPYVVVGEDYGRKPLLARYEFDGEPTFRSVVFVAKDSPVHSLEQLRGKRMAFGNVNSTLSTQVPVYMLLKAGIELSDLSFRDHLRNHENVVLGVEFGDFDAGAVAEEVFLEYRKNHDIRALAHSPALSTHVFVTRSDLPEPLRERIRAALLALKGAPGGAAVLQAIGGNLTGFVEVTDGDYDLHREILSRVLPILRP